MTGLSGIQGSAGIQGVSALAPTAAVESDSKLKDAAKQFEQVLVEQLAQQLEQTAQPADDGSDDGGGGDGGSSAVGGQDAVSTMYTQLLPGALAQGVAHAGGLGLAQQLYDSMKQSQETA
jgi:Rod binding domain-containing protein